ncbi:MAG TPA: UDP-3-O-(3-hydroxymyristoyl)glucosamine N-acyltransferase [Vitreimonas sp.]|uniref:UDP-3-O-(3-hydroxymyristoyl)glucosamine N-acyltransferase n=1 Tax=Vitreimonas sp. TaxID=3069702 RepID=UPI002D6844C7|nr:UDP-3-O-(3-hydroxymyristoyl)glucosamine N-acyltransferase [Vitreimonas sp.]HYD87510.1 UDP-3-O-(3-hydroxymyristoyl)glucosamine N-acyltransferase [Vitreimonas sp.]
MIDPRFYEALGPATVRALAPSGDIGGDAEREVTGVASAERAGPSDLCYFEPKGKSPAPLATAPAACVINPALAHLAPKAGALILTERPRAVFARLVPAVVRPRALGEAQIDPSAKLEEGVSVGVGAVIGANAQIGAGASIGANAVIGPGVAIGRRTRIGARASVAFALIGDDVNILAGAVIGEQGFGVAGDASGPVDVPHLGRVIIQDRVTIGANSCVDRGVFDDTVIGEDTKIDNLCHVAHNCQLGRGVLIAAFAGISGSTVVADGVTMGGRVGIADHRNIGKAATLAGGAAVFQDVPAGEVWSGYPAKPLRKWLREAAWLSRRAAGARDEGK